MSHPIHATDAEPTGGQTELMELRGDSSPARDGVEMLAFLTAPAEVVIDVDGRRTSELLSAGDSVTRAPLAPGSVAAAAVRDGAVVRSPWEVVAEPEVQDLGYRFTASDAGDPYGCDRAAPGPVDLPVPPEMVNLARC